MFKVVLALGILAGVGYFVLINGPRILVFVRILVDTTIG